MENAYTMKRFIPFIIVSIFITIAFLDLADHDSSLAATDGTSKLDESLRLIFADQNTADFIISFNKQADLSAAYAMDWDSRGQFVYDSLSTIADQSQVKARAILEQQNLKYQTFIVGNEQAINLYGTVKDNTDSGQFRAIQKAGCTRLHLRLFLH